MDQKLPELHATNLADIFTAPTPPTGPWQPYLDHLQASSSTPSSPVTKTTPQKLYCSPCKKHFKTSTTLSVHLKSNKHLKTVRSPLKSQQSPARLLLSKDYARADALRHEGINALSSGCLRGLTAEGTRGLAAGECGGLARKEVREPQKLKEEVKGLPRTNTKGPQKLRRDLKGLSVETRQLAGRELGGQQKPKEDPKGLVGEELKGPQNLNEEARGPQKLKGARGLPGGEFRQLAGEEPRVLPSGDLNALAREGDRGLPGTHRRGPQRLKEYPKGPPTEHLKGLEKLKEASGMFAEQRALRETYRTLMLLVEGVRKVNGNTQQVLFTAHQRLARLWAWYDPVMALKHYQFLLRAVGYEVDLMGVLSDQESGLGREAMVSFVGQHGASRGSPVAKGGASRGSPVEEPGVSLVRQNQSSLGSSVGQGRSMKTLPGVQGNSMKTSSLTHSQASNTSPVVPPHPSPLPHPQSPHSSLPSPVPQSPLPSPAPQAKTATHQHPLSHPTTPVKTTSPTPPTTLHPQTLLTHTKPPTQRVEIVLALIKETICVFQRVMLTFSDCLSPTLPNCVPLLRQLLAVLITAHTPDKFSVLTELASTYKGQPEATWCYLQLAKDEQLALADRAKAVVHVLTSQVLDVVVMEQLLEVETTQFMPLGWRLKDVGDVQCVLPAAALGLEMVKAFTSARLEWFVPTNRYALKIWNQSELVAVFDRLLVDLLDASMA